jgi:hypothetical protein
MREVLTSEALKRTYQWAKTGVMCAGYADEIEWQRSVRFEEVTESDLLRENAWVVLCCGMREAIVRERFAEVSRCFQDWRSADHIIDSLPHCREQALRYFRHPAKIDAIIACAAWVAEQGFAKVKGSIRLDPLGALRTLPFIGPVTAYHLAKNLGLPVAKPDRHLVRLSRLVGYQDVQEFCDHIAEHTGDPVAVVDIVLWRFATLRSDYLDAFARELVGGSLPEVRHLEQDVNVGGVYYRSSVAKARVFPRLRQAQARAPGEI